LTQTKSLQYSVLNGGEEGAMIGRNFNVKMRKKLWNIIQKFTPKNSLPLQGNR